MPPRPRHYVLKNINHCIFALLLRVFQDEHPFNFLLLALFTLCISLVLGLAASFVTPTIILEAATATVAVVVTLTAYTFWAGVRGEDFGFLAPFLLTVLVTVVLIIFYMIFSPVRKILDMLYSGLFVLLFSLYMIYDTNVMIKRNTYDEYIWASVMIYVDILDIFLRLLRIFALATCR